MRQSLLSMTTTSEQINTISTPAPIRERRRASDRQSLETLFELAPIGMIVCKADGKIKRVNPALCKLLGFNERDILSGRVNLTDPDDPDRDKWLREQLAEPGVRVMSVERMFLRSDGSRVQSWVKAIAERDNNDKLKGYVLQVVDITEREALRRELERVVGTDSLTGLDDRPMFLRRLEHGLDIMSNAGELSVLIVSVSGLGIVNEAHGPEVGDALLVAFARKLESLLPATSRLGRLGSDQFGVLVPECPARVAVEVAEQLQQAFEEPLNISSQMLSVSPNIGIANYPSDSTTASGLLRCAELAARHARRNNCNFIVYTESFESGAEQRLDMVMQLRQAIRRGALEITFEPILCAVTGKLVFCEALVRWLRDDKLVGPESFIPLAEETGLVRELDTVVMRRALRQMGRMDDDERPAVSVNLSPISLLDPRLVERMLVLVSYHGLSPKSLIVEITETSLANHHETIAPNLKALRRSGVRIAIDDFGAGNTSLSLLRSLEIDMVKVDRSFIAGIGDNPVDEAIVESVIEIARTRDLIVVAEGVEKQSQHHWLALRGCDYVQGYLFRKSSVNTPTD